jgi:hypothetical protein
MRQSTQIDPRGQRFGATVTSVLLVAVLVTGSWFVLAVQTVVFAVSGVCGLRYSPYALIYKRWVRPRLGPPTELEAEAPPRFAQFVGLGFAVVGVVGFTTGIAWLGIGATALALGAAFLNAAFGFCLGCEMYLLTYRVLPQKRSNKEVPA